MQYSNSTINQLYQEAQSYAASRRGDLTALAWHAGLSSSWVRKFATGRVSNPTLESLDKILAVKHAAGN